MKRRSHQVSRKRGGSMIEGHTPGNVSNSQKWKRITKYTSDNIVTILAILGIILYALVFIKKMLIQ